MQENIGINISVTTRKSTAKNLIGTADFLIYKRMLFYLILVS